MSIKHKKIIIGLSASVIIAVYITSISGCGNNKNKDKDSNYYTSLTESTTTTTTTTAATTTTKSTTKKETTKSSSKSDSKSNLESYYCMGKHDTCTNKTYDPWDFYCHSCDPDDNNIEGDQRY